MKRLLLGVLFGSFLALIGVQAAHTHGAAAPESCSVCALGHQSARHAPAGAPAVVRAVACESVAATVVPFAAATPSPHVRARAPPAAS